MRKSGSRIAIISVLLVGLVIFGVVYYGWTTVTNIFQPVDAAGAGKIVHFEISKGESTSQIADDLRAKGLIRDPLAFRIWARIKGLDTSLQAGIYDKLNSSMTISDIIDQLLNAQPDAIRVVIPEGWRIEQIAQRFGAQGLVKFHENEFLNYTKNIKSFPDAAKYPILQSVPSGYSMEGLLFPASYEVRVDATARDVVNLMLQALNANIQQHQLDKLAAQHQLSTYKMIILASLVQREVVFNQDSPGVASVYWNRVFVPNNETAGLLGSDPSVQYALDTQNKPKVYWKNFQGLGRDNAPNSPWNTYNSKGFPPTPICSPGLASLEAAASPAKTDYLYFLGKTDGHIVFARTYAEFLVLTQKYLH